MSLLHDRLAQTALMYVIILALWGLWRYFRGQGLDGAFWGALVVAEIVIVLQGIFGGYLWLAGLRPARGGIHILYGLASALVIPGVFAFTRGGNDRRALFIYAIGLLFLAGLILRGITTGSA
jgi:hypothetical protein